MDMYTSTIIVVHPTTGLIVDRYQLILHDFGKTRLSNLPWYESPQSRYFKPTALVKKGPFGPYKMV